ncbi:Acetyltransferase (GNAT) family [Kingella potus]|uniref:Acetyltransferase (GNAT) family n=1 Tax=Kingella potus TaxID=265175 RepID=A0A377R158_9NEIS|nr:GNAT family N-acetyltransferase [Kingella potus]STR00829.1 Acetyltransferase (GNAT) family [Kingella potus]
MEQAPQAVHLPAQCRFRIEIGGREAGYIAYEEQNGAWNVVHTEVSPDFRGRGIAAMLVGALTEHAAARNIPLTAECCYAARFIAQKQTFPR